MTFELGGFVDSNKLNTISTKSKPKPFYKIKKGPIRASVINQIFNIPQFKFIFSESIIFFSSLTLDFW